MTSNSIESFLPGAPISGFDTGLLVRQKADLHLATREGTGRCSLWWTTAPDFGNEKVGIVGHFQADFPQTGVAILGEAVARLRSEGCTLAIGPMDGNTWRRYRVLTERGNEPTFFLEPDNPDWWAQAFEGSGFLPLSTYSSSLVTDLSRSDLRAARAFERLSRDGVVIRSLNVGDFEGDLRRIYRVSVASFTENYLYTEVSEEDFLAQYLPYREKIRPELVLLAEQAGQPVGYLFTLPDYAEAQRGKAIRTVIGKTLAVLPGRRYGGLGVVLVGMLHARARSLGYDRLIHALQHETNQVRNISGFFGEVMRRYTLYSRRLA